MPLRPNILWLMSDEQRLDSMGYTGTPWARSPNLDRLARAGTRFDAAYTPSPVCVPARACVLCARPSSSIGVYSLHHELSLNNPRFLTWTFAESGYQTASFGKSHYHCKRRAFETEGGSTLGDKVGYFAYNVDVDEKAAGTVVYEGGIVPWMLAGRFPGSIEETPEMDNVRQACVWLDARDPERPFFLRASLNAPHSPVCPPAPFDTLIEADAIDLPMDFPDTIPWRSTTEREHLHEFAGAHRLTETQIQRARQAYYGHCAFADHAFGVLLDRMRDTGDLDNTLIVFLADHGTHLGDHGFFQKQSFYEPSVNVPFFFSGPGVPEDTVIDKPINIGSTLPTLLDLTGIGLPSFAEYPSLVPYFEGKPPEEDPVFSEIDFGMYHYRLGDRCVMVRHGKYKLTLFRDPRDKHKFSNQEEDRCLFDLESDQSESRDISGLRPEIVLNLEQALAAMDARPALSQPIDRNNLTEAEQEALQALGYVEAE
jgi:arylsulfatase